MKGVIKYCLDETAKRVAIFKDTLNRRTKGRSLGTFLKRGAVSEVRDDYDSFFFFPCSTEWA
jgi:hypothetical protein